MTQNKLIKTIKSLFVQEVNADERAMTIGDTSRQLTTQEHNPASKLNVDNTYHVIKNAFHQNNLEIRKNAAQQVTLAKKIAAGYVIPGSTAILCDTSYSMQIPNETGRKRIDLLHQAIDLLAKKYPGTPVVEFNSTTKHHHMFAGLRFTCRGETRLALALGELKKLRSERAILISDGRPHSENKSLAVAQSLTTQINTIYCGPEDDMIAQNFLAKLTAMKNGQFTTCDITDPRQFQKLTLTCEKLLALPSPTMNQLNSKTEY